MTHKSSLLLSLGLSTALSLAANNVFTVQTDKPGAPIQPTMYGLFFEDINYAADGGLYAEMIKNRSFEFPQNFAAWVTYGDVKLQNDGPFERNPHYVRLASAGHNDKHTGLENEGFFGVTYKKGENYRFSVWARSPQGKAAKIRVELENPASMKNSQVDAKKEITIDSKEWKKYEVTLTPDKDCSKGKLRIFLVKPDTTPVDLEHISLFPEKTWQGHENGLRVDLAQKLADLKPGIFRFPGGCIVEGTDLDTRYQWKNTVGPVENRPVNENRWHYTFPHRFYPDYYQSGGLGFYEYFLLSEEIGAEPLPVLSVGLACQFQNHEESAHVPVNELQPYIQDALDLIEFANGGTDTKWGALRAEMGHAAPFNLKFIAIGNEQWGPEYPEHLEPFVKAIRKAYPDIKIVGSSGPDSEGEQFDYLWPEMKKLGADLVDEHFYRPETWFLAQGNRYDNYDRKGPKVFAGEYACHGKGKKWNHFNTALLEAAFMTGLERNADIVHMATYAPLFAHVEGWQWRPDMIWFDNSESFPTSSYYVQQLYSLNKGTNVLPTNLNGKPAAGNEDQNGLFASAVVDKNTGEYIVKVANTSSTVQPFEIKLAGLKKKETINSLTVTTLSSADPDAENSLENPGLIMPLTKEIDPSSLGAKVKNAYTYNASLEPNTFYVFKFKKAE
ncbi:MAG: carbohydrate binding domain-containing protein [Muribaculaceae bacterium]|nr:carbohydrate binding domain-containing protein [Muribaculaceae bacterium]